MAEQSRAAQLAADEAWNPGHNPWFIALTVTLATFMEVLDTSIANVALPHIAGGLAASPDESTWVLTSYLVSNAIVLPLSGWFSSRIGRKRFYMSCVALFTFSSFLCGFAPSLPMLILFRVLQGIGGGGLQPSEQAILADTFAPAKRGMAFAIYGMAVVAAPALGPTLGGWITDNYTWRWIFFINVPIGFLSLMLSSRLVSDPPWIKAKKGAGVKIDYIGFGLLALGLGLLQVVLDKGEREDWFQTRYITVFTVISVVALVGLVIWELRRKDPIVDFKLLRDRTFFMACLMLFVVGFALYGTTVLLPQFVQMLMGYTAELAGLVISPGGFALMVLMPLVGFLVSRYDPRWLIAIGLVIVSVSLFHMTIFDLNTDFKTMVWARIYQSAGLAFLFVPINTAAYAYLPREKNNQASGLINLARNIGGSVGISFVTTMLARRAQFHQTVLVSHLTPQSSAYLAGLRGMAQPFISAGSNAIDASQQAYGLLYNTVFRQANVLSYIDNFWVLAVGCLVMVPLVFLMKKPPKGATAAAH
jgi:DHA2 family multidrug resistance protein